MLKLKIRYAWINCRPRLRVETRLRLGKNGVEFRSVRRADS